MPPRFFKHGELPLVLLVLVAESPRHRYELLAELARLFGPRYRPSPGSVYPAIDALETERLITARHEGDKVVYRITQPGERAIEDRAEMLAALELRAGVRLSGAESLDSVLTRFKARLLPLSGHVDPIDVAGILDRAAGEIESLRTNRSRKSRTHA